MILVIKLGALGDFVLADSAFKAIRQHHPKEKIVLLTTPGFKAWGEKLGLFDEVFSMARFKIWDIVSWIRLITFFHRHRFHTIYDLQMVTRTKRYYGVWKFFSRHSFLWVGHVGPYKNYLGPAFFQKHPRERFQILLKQAGIFHIPELDMTRLGEPIVVEGLTSPYVLIVPSTSNAFQGAKTWPLESYKAIIQKLLAQHYKVVVIGGAMDDHTALGPMEGLFDLTGKTSLFQIITLAKNASCALGGDTGPMHLAAASKCPIFQLFSKKVLPPSQVGARGPLYKHLESSDLQTLTPDTVWNDLEPFLSEVKNYRGYN